LDFSLREGLKAPPPLSWTAGRLILHGGACRIIKLGPKKGRKRGGKEGKKEGRKAKGEIARSLVLSCTVFSVVDSTNLFN
jgi:hypothetical protein